MDQRPSMIDPYRTLGLEAGASMPDVKRAYRRLAKAYHPDSAGEAALPRFLAIHEAYEAIRSGRPMASGRRSAGTAAASTPAAEPWRADPDRARAAREQARRRAGTRAGGTTGGAAGGGSPSAGATGTSAGGAGGSGGGGRRTGQGATGRTGTSGEARGAGPGAGSGRTSSGGGRGRRHVRKATMGSTSYDEARDPADPNDPSWSGASWYGPSTGEYWIINPREYADPRKHGPEYQSRARRMAAAAMGGNATGEDASADALAEELDVEDEAGASAGRPTTSGDAAWTFGTQAPRGPRAEEAQTRRAERKARPERSVRPARPARETWAGREAWATREQEARQPGHVSRGRGADGIGLGLARAGSPREWIGGPADDPVRRLGLALVAWPPIGLAAAAAIGNVTGCAVYSADCGGTEPLLPWLAQAAILGLLLLLPPIARILAGGAIGVLVALVPLTAFLVAVGGTGAPQAGFALGFLLAVAWLLGILWGVAQIRRRGPARAAP